MNLATKQKKEIEEMAKSVSSLLPENIPTLMLQLVKTTQTSQKKSHLF